MMHQAAAVYVAKVEHASGGRVTGAARSAAVGGSGQGTTAATVALETPRLLPTAA
jgi:hypothetical protein